MVGESAVAWQLRERLSATARLPFPVLLWGESGAGKEIAARALHARSRRARGPFIGRNAATFPEALIEAELFGHARNFPNPGMAEREGLVGAAAGGTLLLDEIGEVPEALHALLLRLLDTGGEYHRLGESQVRRADIRFIAATNRPLNALKHDLLARLRCRIEVPGLNERRSDIPLLVDELLRRMADHVPDMARRFDPGDPPKPRVQPALLERLLRHHYTHHARELESLLHVAVTSSPASYVSLTPQVLQKLEQDRAVVEARQRASEPPASVEEPAPRTPRVDELACDAEGRELRAALERNRWKMGQTAAELGISRHALRRRLQRYGLA